MQFPGINLMDSEVRERKSSSKLAITVRLIGVSFVIFIFIITIKPQIFFQEEIVALELILSIPFLLTAALSFSKLSYAPKSRQWDFLSWVTFLIGYTCLLNVIGIIVATSLNIFLALVFFIVNWVLSLAYSYTDSYPKRRLSRKDVFKNLFFILLQFLLGVLPALGVI
jgi:O-antigen/teichoic acid export membrane protein